MIDPTPYILAKNITLDRAADGSLHLTIDGDPFPYQFAPELGVTIARGALSTVTLTLLASKVVINDERDEAVLPDLEHTHEHGAE